MAVETKALDRMHTARKYHASAVDQNEFSMPGDPQSGSSSLNSGNTNHRGHEKSKPHGRGGNNRDTNSTNSSSGVHYCDVQSDRATEHSYGLPPCFNH